MSAPRKPAWLKKRLPLGKAVSQMEGLVERFGLNTVCHGAMCPNQNECYDQGTATFLILGSRCTRRCRFCSIPTGDALPPPDLGEADRVAGAVKAMGLSHAVITSVTRDDLEDGGASLFAAVIVRIREKTPEVRVEVLIPDFQGSGAALDQVLEARPAVLNHNIETVPSLYTRVRPGADYPRSLDLLAAASARGEMPVKSGLMLGLGETAVEVEATLNDLRRAGVEIITLGQYLQPGPACLEVVEYVTPEAFEQYAALARRLGFRGVASGPFVRSSHEAGALYRQYEKKAREP